MRLTTFLAVVLIALFPFRAQAQNPSICMRSQDLHESLIQIGYFPLLAAITDSGFNFQIYTAPLDFDGDSKEAEAAFILILEDGDTSCIATQGPYMSIIREVGL